MSTSIAVDQFASPEHQQYSHENHNHESEEKIVQEFTHLLEKSKQLFNGLRYDQ